jgi:hypothetical protein
MMRFSWCGVVLCGVAAAACAQQPASRQGTGTVTGHVIYGDTQLPARFAHVTLFGVPAEVTPAKPINPDASTEEQAAAMLQAFGNIGKINMVNTQTDTGGDFVATDVAPGDYYVFATATGYESPLSQVEAAIDAGADLKRPLPGLQIVHVSADHTAVANPSMVRGAAVSGTVTWDDGSPVPGAIMTAVPPKGPTPRPPQQFNMLAIANVLGAFSVTDDQGHFRIAGLMPGDYVVMATVQSGGQTGIGAGSGISLNKLASVSPLVVYAPSAFHKADAKPVTLAAGEDRRDQQVVLNLGGLHAVSGRVESMEDHHGLNSAELRLTDPNDKEFSRTASVDAMGNFRITFVPPGTYTLAVSDAEDTEPTKPGPKDKPRMFAEDKTLRSYADAKKPIVVTDQDVSGQDFSLALDKNPKKDMDFSKILGGVAGGDESK